MSNWAKPVLTKKGLLLQAKVDAGAEMSLTKCKLGSGELPSGQSLEDLTDLVTPVQTIGIASISYSDDDKACEITATTDNNDLTEGYYLREFGVYAQDPDEGEILYAVTSDDTPDYIPASGTSAVLSQELSIALSFSNAANVSAVVNTSAIATINYVNNTVTTAVADLKDMTGATTSTNGVHGLVPAPTKGSATRYLRSDGAWSNISTMTGATTSADGKEGLVPAPSAGGSNRYLSANGQWEEVEEYVLPKATASVLGGIKVGDGLSVLDGLLSATASAANTGGIVAANLADNGYVKFANGLIVQWGKKTLNGRNKNFTYPITFNTLWYVNVLGYSNVETFITSASTSSVTFNFCNGYRDDYQDGTYDCYMFAVGK